MFFISEGLALNKVKIVVVLVEKYLPCLSGVCFTLHSVPVVSLMIACTRHMCAWESCSRSPTSNERPMILYETWLVPSWDTRKPFLQQWSDAGWSGLTMLSGMTLYLKLSSRAPFKVVAKVDKKKPKKKNWMANSELICLGHHPRLTQSQVLCSKVHPSTTPMTERGQLIWWSASNIQEKGWMMMVMMRMMMTHTLNILVLFDGVRRRYLDVLKIY